MLHHNEGVAQITEVTESGKKLIIIPLMETDGGLIENIENAHQAAADLGRQADTLALAARQRAAGAAQGEIVQAHRLQETQPLADLLQDLHGDDLLLLRKLQMIEKRDLLIHGQGGHIEDGLTAHGDCQRLAPQPLPLAGGAGTLGHEGLNLLLAGIGLGLPIAALQVVGNALKGLVQHALATGLIVFQCQLLPLRTVEDHILHRGGELLIGRAEGEIILLCQGIEIHAGDAVGADGVPARGHHRTVQDGLALIGHHQRRINLLLHAKTCAGRAGTEGVIEGEEAGRQFFNGDAAILTGIVLRELKILFLTHQVDAHKAACEMGGCLHTVGKAAGNILADNKTIHHDVDVVLDVLGEGDLLIQFIHLSIHADADIAAAAGIGKDLGMLTLASTHHRCHHLDACTLGQGHNAVDDLIHRLLADLFSALGTVGRTYPRPQKAHIVIDLRHRTHGGAGILGCGFLIDGDGGAQALNIVHIGLVHLPQKHTGIGAEGLHIAALSLGIDGIECQRGLAAAAETRQHHQLVAGDGYINILQVILPRAFYENFFMHGFLPYSLTIVPAAPYLPAAGQYSSHPTPYPVSCGYDPYTNRKVCSSSARTRLRHR